MGVTVLPYIDQTQTARLQEAASANIQTPKNTDEAVTTFKECLASAERSVQAMAVDALLAASNSGAVSIAIALLSFLFKEKLLFPDSKAIGRF